MILNLLSSLLCIGLCDKCVQKYCSKARWYALHAIINFINVSSTQYSLIKALQDPINISTNTIMSYRLFSSYSIWPTILTMMLHLYHFLFFNMRREDFIHHLLFVPFLLCNLSYEAKNLTIFLASNFIDLRSYKKKYYY